jgi:hypothetical protein
MLPRGDKNLNSIQLLASRPFQDQRKTRNLALMSHSSHAERCGTWRDKKTHAGLQKQIHVTQLTRQSTIDTQT